MTKVQNINLSQSLLRLIGSETNSSKLVEKILAQIYKEYQARCAVLIKDEIPTVIVTDTFSIPDSQIAVLDSLDLRTFTDTIQTMPEFAEDFAIVSEFWAMCPLRDEKDVFGLLWLEADHEIAMDEDVWQPIVDALMVAGRVLYIEAKHQRHTRNKVEFIRIVAHDLRSPLTAMKGFLGVLDAMGELNEQQSYYVEKIHSGISQMSLLVDNFQDAGRYDPETGFYELQRSPCDVTDIVQQIVSNYLVPAEKQELTVSSHLAQDIPIINADQIMLERAIINLVDNAIKYTPNGGEIEISTALKDESIVIGVKDNGFGIKPEDKSRLFERHVRGNRKEHRRIKGSGLGLFIVKSVAQRHGGRAWVESKEGEGTTFFIGLPLDNFSTTS